MNNFDYLYDKEQALKFFEGQNFSDEKIHFKIIERGTILPHKHLYINGKWTWGFGGILDKKGNFISSSHINMYDVDGIYTPTEEIQYSPKTIIYLNIFYPVWGHSITNYLARIWFLKSNVYKSVFKDCPVVYLPWNGNIFLNQLTNFRRLLEILEIDVDKLQPITRPINFEQIILPDESVEPTLAMNFTQEYIDTIDQVRNFAKKNQKLTSYKKIYYFYGKAQVGEERLAEYFHDKGYEIISPEKLSIDEQLNLMINCDSFASTIGSCSHNSIFMRDNSEVILIPRFANKFTPYQKILNQVHPINATYIDSSLSIFEKFNGPYCFIISEQLKKFFGEKFTSYSDDDLKNFLAYIRCSVARGYEHNKESLQYYSSVYSKIFDQLKQRKDLLKAYNINLN